MPRQGTCIDCGATWEAPDGQRGALSPRCPQHRALHAAKRARRGSAVSCECGLCRRCVRRLQLAVGSRSRRLCFADCGCIECGVIIPYYDVLFRKRKTCDDCRTTHTCKRCATRFRRDWYSTRPKHCDTCAGLIRIESDRRHAAKASIHRNHMRRAGMKQSDMDAAYERKLRKNTRDCPECGVGLTNKPGLPNSKELDHKLPLNRRANGSHIRSNVRIICRRCNSKRPWDGSDLDIQLPLLIVERQAVPPKPKREKRYVIATRRTRYAEQQRAAYEARHVFGMQWQQVATVAGYASPGAAFNASWNFEKRRLLSA